MESDLQMRKSIRKVKKIAVYPSTKPKSRNRDKNRDVQ